MIEAGRSAQRTGTTIRQEVVERGLMTGEDFDRLVADASGPLE